jgi:hypothetical protein
MGGQLGPPIFILKTNIVKQKGFTFGRNDITFTQVQGEFMLVGIFLICLGALFILNNLGFLYGGVGRYILPILLIALGASIMLKKIRSGNSQS